MAKLSFSAASGPGQAPKIYCTPHPGQPPCTVEHGEPPSGGGSSGGGGGKGGGEYKG